MPDKSSISRIIFGVALAGVLLSAVGCRTPTAGVEPVSDFDFEKYKGTWYEIARYPHSFEKHLTDVTAVYEERNAGEISVTNRGYNTKRDSWSTAKATGNFAGKRNIGVLRVSFFWPFYGAYRVLHVDGSDKQYQHAIVTGSSTSYLWILARSPRIPDAKYKELLRLTRQFGFDTAKLQRVPQDRN